MMTVKKILINDDNEGRRIDNFLISIFSTVPKSKIYNIIRKGEVRVNSSRKKPNYKLKLNDLIRIPPNLEILDKKINIIKSDQISKHTKNIIYENDNFIVANKRNKNKLTLGEACNLAKRPGRRCEHGSQIRSTRQHICG